MKYNMKLLEDEFNNIKSYNKTVEVRLNDKKRKSIQIGDEIKFCKLSNIEESVIVKVEKILVFTRFIDLYSEFPKSLFGYENMEMEEIMNKIYKIYTKEQEELLGVIAIGFSLER